MELVGHRRQGILERKVPHLKTYSRPQPSFARIRLDQLIETFFDHRSTRRTRKKRKKNGMSRHKIILKENPRFCTSLVRNQRSLEYKKQNKTKTNKTCLKGVKILALFCPNLTATGYLHPIRVAKIKGASLIIFHTRC